MELRQRIGGHEERIDRLAVLRERQHQLRILRAAQCRRAGSQYKDGRLISARLLQVTARNTAGFAAQFLGSARMRPGTVSLDEPVAKEAIPELRTVEHIDQGN